ncbi:hypothetical protein, partial [Escherichia coli]
PLTLIRGLYHRQSLVIATGGSGLTLTIFNYITRSIDRVNVLRSAMVGDPLFCSMNTIIQLNQESV